MSKEVRQSIKDDWEEFKIYPLETYPDIDPTRYRVTSEGRIVKGEWYGDKAGLPVKVHYDNKLKMAYCNIHNNLGEICRVYCENLRTYHKDYESNLIISKNINKVYLVTSGEYSDYGVDAVFKDKEKAEVYAKIQNEIHPYENFRVDEREFHDDKVDVQAKVAYYYYCYITKDGEVVTDDEEKEPIIDKGILIVKSDKHGIAVYSKSSYKHAKKVAIETYQMRTQQKFEDGE